ncbi:MAG: phosphotransferase enzyme family protein [Flavicella sp.]
MTEDKLQSIFEQFDHGSDYDSYKELASGHINDTFLIVTKNKPYYVLQRINHEVFKDVPGLVENKVSISAHIRGKLNHLPQEQIDRSVLTFIKTKNGASCYRGDGDNYWNLMQFIDESVTFELVKDTEVAYEGGKLFGEFINLTSDYDVSKLIEVIPNFHNMAFRYEQFDAALSKASEKRILQAQRYIDIVADMKEEMHVLQNLKDAGEIPIRVTHNDTKISNALFDTNNKGLCVIDTDTIMPGIVHYDFGDAIRTICNTASEDETDLDLVEFNVDYYKAYTKGYLEQLEDALTEAEIKHLPLAAKTMIFIIALRFLTDFLNNDIYFKSKYANHNLDRAKNQFKLIESLQEKYDQIKL